MLDAGCGVGIIAYEIAKRSPSFIHGIDALPRALAAAQMIFRHVGVPARFDQVDLCNGEALRAALRPGGYDIVLFLSVYSHLKQVNPAGARRAGETLAAHCNELFLVRLLPADLPEFEALVAPSGFVRTAEGVSRGASFRQQLYVFRR